MKRIYGHLSLNNFYILFSTFDLILSVLEFSSKRLAINFYFYFLIGLISGDTVKDLD